METQINKKDTSNGRGSRKFRLSFKKGLLAYSLFVLVLLFIGLGIFWRFIANYEESMPVHGMEKVIDSFESGDITEVFQNLFDGEISEFQTFDEATKQSIVTAYNTYITGKEISFVKSSEYSDKDPIYIITADGVKIAEVNLKSTKRNSSNFKVWEFDTISIMAYASAVLDVRDITIEVPEKTVVTVNGVMVTEEYKEDETTIKELAGVSEYIAAAPKMITYKISGLLSEPDVRAMLDGEALKITTTEDTYLAAFTADEEFVTEMEKYVDDVAVAYAMNFINIRKNILPYVMPDSVLYDAIKSATTAWYPNSKIDSYEFSEKTISNFQVYAEDCFSCDVKYTLDIKFIKSYNVEDPTESGNFKWYFVNKDGEWKLTDITFLD